MINTDNISYSNQDIYAKPYIINPSTSDLRPQKTISAFSFANSDFRFGLVISLLVHFFIIFLLFYDMVKPRPAIMNLSTNVSSKNGVEQSEVVKAVSVDANDLEKELKNLRQERMQKAVEEKLHQEKIAQAAQLAQQKRMQEEKRIQQLKAEADKIALAKKKAIAEEKKRLQELAQQKEQESLRLAKLREEAGRAQKQAELARQKAEEANKLRALEKAKEQSRLAAVQAAQDQTQKQIAQAQIAGEVDKYKALITDAISRQWILPENINKSLSSQFRIRLAPDGGVLEVSLTRSSGDPILDRSAEHAIFKASPLPIPTDPHLFNLFREISLTVRPENVRG